MLKKLQFPPMPVVVDMGKHMVRASLVGRTGVLLNVVFDNRSKFKKLALLECVYLDNNENHDNLRLLAVTDRAIEGMRNLRESYLTKLRRPIFPNSTGVKKRKTKKKA